MLVGAAILLQSGEVSMLRFRFRHPRRRQTLMMLGLLLTVALLLLALGAGLGDYRQNVAVNVGTDLIGAIVTIFVITPLITRIDEGRVREHPRLDYGWYADLVAGATSVIRILDTFSNLLDGPFTQRFLRGVEQALQRETVVRILLLDPASLAAVQRASELRMPDAQREIMRNLRVLREFEHELQPTLRRCFQVRLYSVSPSITLYQWDDKALASFLPVGELSGRSAQLEVSISSPLGEFVSRRFNELWASAKPLSAFMRVGVTLLDQSGGTSRQFETEYVDTDGGRYLADPRLMAHLARHRASRLAYCADDAAVMYEVGVVEDDDQNLLATLTEQFQDKYGQVYEVFVWLRRLQGPSEDLVSEFSDEGVEAS